MGAERSSAAKRYCSWGVSVETPVRFSFGECDLVVLDAAEGLQVAGRGYPGVAGLEPLPENAVQHQGDETDRCMGAGALR